MNRYIYTYIHRYTYTRFHALLRNRLALGEEGGSGRCELREPVSSQRHVVQIGEDSKRLSDRRFLHLFLLSLSLFCSCILSRVHFPCRPIVRLWSSFVQELFSAPASPLFVCDIFTGGRSLRFRRWHAGAEAAIFHWRRSAEEGGH